MRYFDLPEEFSGENSKVVILPVPFEETTSYGKGTASGPEAILEASQQVELFDEELKQETYSVGIETHEPLDVSGTHADVLGRLENAVATLSAKGKVPFILGGEHSITPACVRGVAKHHKNITVVQIDAHADLRDEWEGTKLSHACTMARVREQFPAVQIGIRNLSKEEMEWVERDNLPVFFAHKIRHDENWIDKVIKAIKTDDIYITIDLDGLDSSLMPATGTPEPGGMGWYQTTDVLRAICKKKRVVGFDLVELSPVDGMHAPDFLAAKLIYKCIGYSM